MCAFCRTPGSSGAVQLALAQKRVDAKDPVAIGVLANAHYHEDYGLQQDIPRAIELWTQAVHHGDLDSHFRLGFLYYAGGGVERDEAKAIYYWQHAAIQGHPDSRLMLGFHERRSENHELAIEHWMIAAKMGHEKSLNAIKDTFMEGHATKEQYAEALRGHQTALEETKSLQREEANAFFRKKDKAFSNKSG